MAAYNKFNFFVQDLCEALHNFKTSGGGTYKIILTNTAPVATNHVYADVSGTELTTTGGYTAGGATLTLVSESQSSGTEKVVVSAASPTWTGSGGGFGPFRYVILYRSDDTNKELVCWFDYGSSISVNAGDTFTVTFDATNGLFQIT